ncbi:hypothetical protein B4N84_23720 [Flavobacterium sp. IR1]|nr:hypothetical protein B4N84_23720 [Flavobacterium sp. IR1]
MSKKVLCVLVAVLSQSMWSQSDERIVLSGKIVSEANDLEGVYVINAQTEETITTNSDGSFSIKAKAGETLVFSSIRFREKRILLKAENFTDLNFAVKLSMVMYQLQEVVVKNYNNINAVNLGIVPAGQRTYTPAERKLKTATALDPSANAENMMAGGSISADPLLNFFSGRTAMLKKEVKVEKKEYFMRLLEKMFTLDHFVNRLSIPKEYVKGFEYYAVDNDKFTIILDSKNRTTTEFLLGELAVKYKQILAVENK